MDACICTIMLQVYEPQNKLNKNKKQISYIYLYSYLQIYISRFIYMHIIYITYIIYIMYIMNHNMFMSILKPFNDVLDERVNFKNIFIK